MSWSGKIVDPKHTVQKFAKDLNLINTKREVAFVPAARAFVTRNAR
jgi:hypothetical protein